MELFNEVYQLLFFGSIFFIIRLLTVLIWRFKAFKKALAENNEEVAKGIVFSLKSQESYLLLICVGIILAYLL